MEIKKLSKNELEIALEMVWKVFCEYEAVNYPEGGKEAFYQAIHSEEYLAMLEAYGALCDEKIVGIMATRNEGTHVALFFVDGKYHRKGIGKKLWEAVLSNTSANLITVHSSLYAAEIYKKLGFYQTDSVKEDGGIQYIPMEYNVLQKAKEDIISALAQPWTLHDRIGLSRLIYSKDKLKLEEIDQIRITHYIDDYAFLEGNMSIEAARAGFEASFEESNFYNKQTQDENHLNNILKTINIKPGMKILDLGCGSGYLTFPIAQRNEKAYVVGLDIVTDTLERNAVKAQEMDIKNLEFISYDGITFPFEDSSFDLVVTRYALHHFPEIRKSIHEVARVLRSDGLFFVSDPRPNDCDITRFVDEYMQLKKDGHIKFYTKDEWVQICRECNMHLIQSFDSEIRFPKKKSTAAGFEEVLARHEKSIIDSYHLTQTEDEIWVTEQVNNLLFQKK